MATDRSPQTIAAWMLSEVERRGRLYAAAAADEIDRLHGAAVVGYDDEGKPFLKKPVLDAFREISSDNVVWSMGTLCWRKRQAGDRPGREQR